MFGAQLRPGPPAPEEGLLLASSLVTLVGGRGKEQAREEGDSGPAGVHGADPRDSGQRASAAHCVSAHPLGPPGSS